MVMKRSIFFSFWRWILSLFCLILLSCSQQFTDYPEPDENNPYLDGKFNFGATTIFTNKKDYVLLDSSILKRFRGVYSIIGGKEIWGTTVVVHQAGKSYLSMLAGQNGTFQTYERAGVFSNTKITELFGTEYGTLSAKDSSIVLEGFWQTEFDIQSGLIRLVIPLQYDVSEKRYKISDTVAGRYSEEAVDITKFKRTFSMQYLRPLRDTTNSFIIVGHAGGGRNVDRLPYPENSLNLLRFVERIGANGVEIDVRLTKDSVPVLFHDEYMTSRLVNGEYAVGPLANYTYPQLFAIARLKDKTPIPTLRDALRVIVEETNLVFIWLDIKKPEVIPKIMNLVKTFQNGDKAKARGLKIYLGLPDEETANVYAAQSLRSKKPGDGNVEALSEVEEVFQNLDLPAWGPRWTLGTMPSKVAELRAKNKIIIPWTLDDADFLRAFIRPENPISGVLTNHASLAMHIYQTRQ